MKPGKSLSRKNRMKQRSKTNEYPQLLELNRQQLALQIEVLQLEKKLNKQTLQSIQCENKLDRLVSKRESYKQFEV